MISDADLLAYIRPASTDDLTTLRRLERAAVATIQKRTGRYFGVEDAIVDVLNWRGWPMQLTNVPAADSDFTLESWDGSAWTEVDASSYALDGAFIYRNSTAAWPGTLSMPTRYRAIYDTGYEDAGDETVEAPEDIKQAVILLVGHWFENREAVVVGQSQSGELPFAVSALIDPHIRVAI